MAENQELDTIKREIERIEKQCKTGLTGSDKKLVDSVKYRLFGEHIVNKGCGNCYHDACILILLKLRGMSKLPSYDYVLKGGAVLVEPMTGKPYIGGIPNDVAEKFLKINKNKWLPLFAKVPDDLDARLAEQKETTEEKTEVETENRTTEEKTTEGKRKAGRPRKNL